MTVFKAGTTWRVDVYYKGRKVKSKSGFKNKRDAKKWHDINVGLLSVQDHDEVQIKEFKFEDLLLRFSKIHMSTIRPGTQRRYQVDIDYRIAPFFQNRKLNSITQSMVEDFKISVMEEMSVKSANNCLGLLKTIFRKGVEWRMMKLNPSQGVKLQKVPQQKYNWWDNEEDIVRFLAMAKECPYYLAYRLALDLGLRLGEIIGLSKSDVNLNLCQVHIHRQWLDKEKKYGPTKHGRERFIRFPKESELYQLFKETFSKNRGNQIIFLTKNGNRLGARKLSGYFFQKIIEKSGVPKIRFHDLRHTFASWFMIRTDCIWDLKSILGHSDIQTTQRYAHLSMKHQVTPHFDWNK